MMENKVIINMEDAIDILQDMVEKMEMDCCYAIYSTEYRQQALKFAIGVLREKENENIVHCNECMFQLCAKNPATGKYEYWCDLNEDSQGQHCVNGIPEEFCSTGIRKERKE